MQGKRILLGITGGIAAYKIAYLIRIFKKKGAEVKCIMTPASSDFISPLVVATLSQNPVAIEFWDKKTGVWTNHVDLALWADVFVIAPATANSIAKMANGLCDNLLLATYFSLKTKTIICPAMDLDMYQHPSFKRNIQTLIQDGVLVVPATSGELASGLEGEGRMEEPEVIAQFIENYFLLNHTKSNKTVLITAGPTYEAIDPVRFIGNHSSGKMGFALAESCLNRGMKVVLVSGPVQLQLAHPNLTLIRIKSANEMLKAVSENWNRCDFGIFAAAVADYRPQEIATQKIKKKEENLTLELVKNPDILKWASENKNSAQKVIGFALETNNAEENALLKLRNKKLDMIVLNTLENDGAGFQSDTNKITILDKGNGKFEFNLKSKKAVAEDIIETIMNTK
jgi:phosphopantothenoylcysteine decarboxylase/phosphopantothenate--cysteine ligase